MTRFRAFHSPAQRLTTLSACVATAALVGLSADDINVVTPPSLKPTPVTGPTVNTHSWDLPALSVTGARSGLREEDRVGSYEQPRWTARRRFTETRSYVIPEGQFQFEFWYQNLDKRDDKPSTVKQTYEVEVGLPYRFQLDLYQVWEKTGAQGENTLAENSVEVRYALADWGVIPTNPTLYAEYKWVNASADVAEFKLLLSDEFSTKWHWAANLVYERELGGDCTVSKEIIGAISYTLIDEKLSIGAEAKFTWEDKAGERNNYERDQLIGPNLQWRPAPQSHINVAYLINTAPRDVSDNAGRFTAIFGWEF